MSNVQSPEVQNARFLMDSQQDLKTKWSTLKMNISVPLISCCAVSCAAPLLPSKQRVVIGSILARGVHSSSSCRFKATDTEAAHLEQGQNQALYLIVK